MMDDGTAQQSRGCMQSRSLTAHLFQDQKCADWQDEDLGEKLFNKCKETMALNLEKNCSLLD